MRQEPTKEQMRKAATENIVKISAVARGGYETLGRGFVWLQFMFTDEWQLRIEFVPLFQVRQMGLKKDSMDKIERLVEQCNWNQEAAILMFKGDQLESIAAFSLAAENL